MELTDMKKFNPAWQDLNLRSAEELLSPAPLPTATIKPGLLYKFNPLKTPCQDRSL